MTDKTKDNSQSGVDKLTEDQNQVSALQDQYNEERDLVNQLLGQAQMADAFAQFSVTVTTSKLAFVKENKLYKALAGKKTGDGHQFSGTWEDFCKLLGRSREQVDEDIRNLKHLGEEALESMSRMGIGYREMRQYRKLPEDQKVALLEVAKTGDKESFLDLAEEIIARSAKKEEQLSLELGDTKADYEAQSELLSKKSAELDNTRLELEKARKRIQTLPPAEAHKELRQEVSVIAFEAEATLRGKLNEGFSLLAEACEESDDDPRSFMAAQLNQVEQVILEMRERYKLPVHVNTPAIDFLDESLADSIEQEMDVQQGTKESYADESESN